MSSAIASRNVLRVHFSYSYTWFESKIILYMLYDGCQVAVVLLFFPCSLLLNHLKLQSHYEKEMTHTTCLITVDVFRYFEGKRGWVEVHLRLTDSDCGLLEEPSTTVWWAVKYVSKLIIWIKGNSILIACIGDHVAPNPIDIYFFTEISYFCGCQWLLRVGFEVWSRDYICLFSATWAFRSWFADL